MVSTEDIEEIEEQGLDPSRIDPTYVDEAFKIRSELFSSGRYSDMTITCGGETFRVHQAIVCMRSEFFEAAMRNCMEAENQTVNLPVDDPAIVKLMLQWMYFGQYEFLKSDPKFPLTCTRLRKSTTTGICRGFQTGECRCGKDSGLPVLSKLYILADRCLVEGLKKYILVQFREQLDLFWNHFEFPVAAGLVWNNTREDDIIRKEIVDVMTSHPALAKKEGIKRLFNECEGFGYTMFTSYVNIYKEKKKRKKSRWDN